MKLSLAVLSKMLDCNTTNTVSNDFSKLLTRFSEFLNKAWKPEEFSGSQAWKYLDYIRRRLETGDEIRIFQNSTQLLIRESFIRRQGLLPCRARARVGCLASNSIRVVRFGGPKRR